MVLRGALRVESKLGLSSAPGQFRISQVNGEINYACLSACKLKFGSMSAPRKIAERKAYYLCARRLFKV
jgi:hypothetical protein